MSIMSGHSDLVDEDFATEAQSSPSPLYRTINIGSQTSPRVGINKVDMPCNNCGSRNTTRIASGTDFEYETVDEDFNVVRCDDCSLAFLNPRPHVDELPTIYPDSYLAYGLSESDKRQSNSLACRLRRRFYVRKLETALNWLDHPHSRSIDLLDIGAGDGRLLNWFRQIPNVDIRSHAAEMNPVASASLRKQGHTVYEGLFEKAEIPEQTFDVVHSSHVIEHVADPRAFAEKGARLLKPGGIFLVETPNLDCAGARIFRRRYWGGYHFPRHWTFYTPKTLTATLSQAGLEVVDIRFYPNPVFWVWTMHHILKDQRFPRFLYNQFPAVGIFQNSFGNVIRLGAFTAVERMLGMLWHGRMGSMQAVARRAK